MTARDVEELRASVLDDPEVPQVVRDFLARGASLEEIRLDAFGRWSHEGGRFENERLSRLFHRSLHQTARGSWVLQIGMYTYPVIVDLTGVFIERLDVGDHGQTMARLSTGEREPIQWDTLSTDGESFVAARTASGQWARFVDRAYHQLLEGLEDDWSVAWHGAQYPIRILPPDDPLRRRVAQAP